MAINDSSKRLPSWRYGCRQQNDRPKLSVVARLLLLPTVTTESPSLHTTTIKVRQAMWYGESVKLIRLAHKLHNQSKCHWRDSVRRNSCRSNNIYGRRTKLSLAQSLVSTGNLASEPSASQPAQIIVEDIGPA
jgi:hypothetical protein